MAGVDQGPDRGLRGRKFPMPGPISTWSTKRSRIATASRGEEARPESTSSLAVRCSASRSGQFIGIDVRRDDGRRCRRTTIAIQPVRRSVYPTSAGWM